MKSINARTKIIISLAVLAALVALFGVFYDKSVNDVELVERKESSLPEETSPVLSLPNAYEEYLQQGIQYESAGEPDKAIDAYQKAAQAKPEAYVPYSNLGSIYRSMKEFSKAEEAFKQALSIYGEHSRTIDPPTSVYRKLYELYRYDLKKPPDEMTLFFSDALKQTNNDVDLMKLYASYLEDVNDLESALAVWKAFLQAEPANELYAAKIKSLEAKIKTTD